MTPQKHSRLRAPLGPVLLAMIALLAMVPGYVSAQQPTRAPKSVSPPTYVDVLGRTLAIGPLAEARTRVAAAVAGESEPNNNTSTANAIEIGDLIDAEISPSGDIDFFRLDGVAAGTEIELDVAAGAIGSTLDPTVGLYNAAGDLVDFNDDARGLDSHLTHVVAEAGTYFAAVAGFSSSTGSYRLTVTVPVPGPADPTTLFASGFDGPWGLAAGGSGELYVADLRGGTVSRVSPDGTITAIASDMGAPFGIVIDGFGDLLVPEYANGDVFRLNPETGERSTFTSGLSRPTAITIGPTGGVWVADDAGISHFDIDGNRLETINLGSSFQPLNMAFSPDGVLHYSVEETTIHRIDDGVQTVVINGDAVVEGLAFDERGFLYVVNGLLGRVDLYNTSYELVGPAIARTNIGGPSNLAFLRDSSGGMTDRLLVSNYGYQLAPPFVGSIVELNSDGIAAPGLRIGGELLSVTASLPSAMMGAPYGHTLVVEETVSDPTWQLLDGTLPPGLALGSSGSFSGTPESEGTFDFVVQVDAVGISGETMRGWASLTLMVERPNVSTANAANQLLGVPGALTVAEERFLDLIGNHNGRLDLGDYVLFLRDQGVLTLTLTTQITNGREPIR